MSKQSQEPTASTNGTANAGGQQLRRRGLMAAVAGLAAGALATVPTRPVLAGTDGDVVLGINNTTTAPTTVTNTTSGQPALQGQSGGSGSGIGVVGIANPGIGVQGQSQSNYAVYGISVIPGVGYGSGVGLRGESGTGQGIIGLTGGGGLASSASAIVGLATGNNNNGFAGEFRSTQAAAILAVSSSQPGLNAVSTSNAAVFATSTSNSGVQATGVNGVVGVSTGAGAGAFAQNLGNGNAVQGTANGSGAGGTFFSTAGNGVLAQTGSPGQFAAVVRSNNASTDPGLQVLGSFVATGTKSAIVQTADGWRKLYAQESPENWFEDFGEGQLAGGRASIALDPIFLQTIDTVSSRYHVFVTPHTSAVEALAVTVRASDHFEVEANGKGVVDGTFSYRIVAKRKGFAGDRLARTTAPSTVTADTLPPGLDNKVNPVPPPPVLPPVPPIK